MITIGAFGLFIQWARSVLPHVRIDQLIAIGWKGILRFATLLFTAVIVGRSGQ